MLDRRNFLATAAGFPAVLGAADKAGNRRPIMGSGAHTYEAFHDWGETPARIAYGNAHGVVQDSHGTRDVAHTVHANSQSHELDYARWGLNKKRKSEDGRQRRR